MRRLVNWLDTSPRLKELIKWLSSTLAMQRGLPVLFALLMTIISLIFHIIAAFTSNIGILICGATILHIAILVGFFGVLLIDPLGRG
jgi:hypothetical protein